MKQKYKSYIQSKEWYEMKIDLLQIRGCICERCKEHRKPNKLDLHHLTYKRLYNETANDLMLLFRNCHKKEHGITKIKKTITPKTKYKKNKYRMSKKDAELQIRYDNIKNKFDKQ